MKEMELSYDRDYAIDLNGGELRMILRFLEDATDDGKTFGYIKDCVDLHSKLVKQIEEIEEMVKVE